MSSAEEDEYGDIADQDLIEALSQSSQTLPSLPAPRQASRDLEAASDDDGRKRRKKKYRIHVGVDDVPPARVLSATQVDALPDSSPYRIRGPIYRRPRPEPPNPEPKQASTFSAPRYIAPQPKPPQPKSSFARTNSTNTISEDEAYARALQDLPDDAFSSSPETASVPKRIISIGSLPPQSPQASRPRQRLAAPQLGLRQTTLFGGRAAEEVPASQVRKVYNFKVDKAPEPPTHHILNEDTLDTWIYPTNLGAIRDYQFSIVRNGLFNNLLVALPTGLGKTFIAATIMYNFFRWTKDAQIIFVAPTKPLVTQQVGACFNIVGLPRSQTTMLTGDQAPAIRAEEWASKRVFFMTPQTLINDLSHGIADPKKIVLLVVDEAHRATGDYAYVKVVQFIRRFNSSFRILALTATPGSTVEAVQEVIDGLEISKVEIRTEESIDIRQFVHSRSIDQILLDPSDEIIMVKELFAKALQPLLNQLCSMNAYYNKDPMSITSYGMMTARKQWFASDFARRANPGLKFMVTALFSILASIAHSVKLLNFHGIGPFYDSVKDFRQTVAEKGNKASKYKSQVVDSPDFKKMMDRIQSWINREDFVGHPKLTSLCDTVLNHFLDAGEGRLADGAPPSSTRVIVFSEYRDSAEDIARILNRHGPMIRASVFVGQQDSKRSEGMNQAKQGAIIDKFKNGGLNVIVATSIGEEGLDIGQVDLIVCYDASGSPIRMLQRMGRTGRKRAGKIVLLLMRGKEEENFMKAKDNYEKMQKMISDGALFNFRHDLSARILPKDITPVVEKCLIDIPPENTQDNSLPEPGRRAARGKKRPAKKFHMPDGVETGFQTASKVGQDGGLMPAKVTAAKKKNPVKPPELATIPDVKDVLLDEVETMELERRFLNIPGNGEEIEMPDLRKHPMTQRSLTKTIKVPHGSYTKRCVRLFKTLAESQRPEDRFIKRYGEEELIHEWETPSLVEDEIEAPTKQTKNVTPIQRRLAKKKRTLEVIIDSDDHNTPRPAKRQQARHRPIPMSAEVEETDEEPDEPEFGAISSEGEGDDLALSEQASEDESDSGSIMDFVIPSTQTETIETVPSSYPPSPSSNVKPPSQKPFYEPSRFAATQDSLPDLEMIGRGKPTSRRLIDSDDEEGSTEDDKKAPVAAQRSRQRRIVEEDSDDE